jgi:hypothetical protein
MWFTGRILTTSYAYSVNRGGQNFGAGGIVTGGGNSFTFILD